MKVSEYLSNVPVGCMVSVITKKDNSDEDEVVFIIKENTFTLSKIGKSPTINIRGGILPGEDAAALLVMFMLNDVIYKYDIWFDYYSDFGESAVDLLADQDTILVSTVNSSGKTFAQFRSRNPLKKVCKQYIDTANRYQHWTDYSFCKFKRKVYQECGKDEEIMWGDLLAAK
jgi:hypothetical protein